MWISPCRVGKSSSQFFIFSMEPPIFLLELSDPNRGWRQCCDLLWCKAQCCLQFCDGLLQLYRIESGAIVEVIFAEIKEREQRLDWSHETHLLYVCFSLCSMSCLGFGVTTALRAFRMRPLAVWSMGRRRHGNVIT